ncbi:hyaluronidase conohyal-P1-like [Physella acuta]|uniref:hyaluronidase conohyal-P1-like n=1 Tax=Physella acuta TaxID=109671 RepID=UPI0027DAC614|nr:hyaluronidase conohyal-P1-like [Physella acuta]
MAKEAVTCLLATVAIVLNDALGKSQSNGCSAPLILPNLPFFVVWNHPTESCRAKGIDLNLDKWGIIDNTGDKFLGQSISLFYNLGLWPYYSGNETAHNGGIPQLGNLSEHIRKVQADVESTLPDKTFSGLGVIDFEHWRPLYALNYDSLKIYQLKSYQLAKLKFPNASKEELVREATKEFELAAREFLQNTLSNVTSLRASGRWGYYGYPRCWDTYCNTSTVAINDQLYWIYENSTSLYPSIYFSSTDPLDVRTGRITKVLKETLRLKATWSPETADVLAYANCQDGPYIMFDTMELDSAVGLPAEMGLSGAVLWGSSDVMRAKNECTILQQYIHTTLGPYVLNLTSFFHACGSQLCTGHGRCVNKQYESYYQHYLRKTGSKQCQIPQRYLSTIRNTLNSLQWKTHISRSSELFHQAGESTKYKQPSRKDGSSLRVEPENNYDNYVCKCFAGWSGRYCEQPALL